MIIFSETVLTSLECQTIRNYILKNEERIKNLGPDIYSGTSDNSLTGRYEIFNYLNTVEIGQILLPKLKKIFKEMGLKPPISVQCWANTFRKNEGIEYHIHSDPGNIFLSGNIFISGPTNPGTTYNIDGKLVDIENAPGTLTIFNSSLGHMVKPNMNDEIRISMAMDIHEYSYFLESERYFVINSYD